MRRHAPLLIILIFFFEAANIFAEVSFGNLNLNSNDDLLFTAYQNIPGTEAYTSLLLTHLGRKKVDSFPKMITCFPEKMELLNGGNILQIRNRYGCAWYSEATKNLQWISSANRIPVEYTRMGPQSASPNGKYICYVRQTKSSIGQLIIKNVSTQEEAILVEKTPFSYEKVNIKWAPDSSAVLYEKNETIYFSTPEAVFKKVQLPEQYRKIGEGTINSVEWTDEKSIVYIDSDIVYTIQENELYTRGLYSSLVGKGQIVARLPSSFNPYYDRFWCDQYASQLVIVSEDKIVSCYSISSTSFGFASLTSIFSLTNLEGSLLDYNIFWTTANNPVLWIDMLRFDTGKKASSVYTLSKKMELILTVKGSIQPLLSPDKRHVAFTGGTSIYVYDTTTWKQTAKLSGEKIISFVWKDKKSLYIGGTQTVRYWSFDAAAATASSLEKDISPASSGTYEILFLSSVSSAYWNGEEIIACPSHSGRAYKYEKKNNIWMQLNDIPSVQNKTPEQNGKYRVFTSEAQNKLYANGIYVRSLSSSVVTYPLYSETENVVLPQKKTAIVFDAMENAEGIARILYVLDEYNLKGIFFVNGEFIRRYPTEVKQILAAGHECASGFYTTADLTDKDLLIDADFIKRGLARNEDEFFAATGKELSLLWHAPYYHQTTLMEDAGKSAGYRYVKAYTGYSDRVTLEQSEENPAYLYLDSGNLIEAFVTSVEDGSIIPVSVGKVHGTRKDYLYEKIDLLIAAILDNGYSITDVRSLLKN